jgi:ppGpp synthetase/RelA/SpoT-type nucleotidyltranferase
MKPEFKQYNKWFKEAFDVDLDTIPSNIFDHVTTKLSVDLKKTEFWKGLQSNLVEYNDEYFLLHSYPLIKPEPLVLHVKSYESLLNKSYRKNVLSNDNFPDPPSEGWIIPENWFSRIKDVLRTTLTVKYLDGVEFIVNKVKELALSNDFKFDVDYEAREQGYYAAHITIVGKFKIVDINWNKQEAEIPIEIQVTTQLQEVIKTLLHRMYEEVRIKTKLESSKKWQWDYKSQEFSSNYLGHILHYVEGMILEVRDKQKTI